MEKRHCFFDRILLSTVESEDLCRPVVRSYEIKNYKLAKVTEQKSDFEMELGDDEGFHIDNYSGNEKQQSDDQQLILVSR